MRQGGSERGSIPGNNLEDVKLGDVDDVEEDKDKGIG